MNVFAWVPTYALGKPKPDAKPPTHEELLALAARWRTPEGVLEAPLGVRTVIRLAPELARRGISLRVALEPNATIVSLVRTHGAFEFLRSDCDYMLAVDDDIEAEPSTVLEMLDAEPDVIFAAYRARLTSTVATVFPPRRRSATGAVEPVPLAEWPVRKTATGARVYTVSGGGMGLCLVSRKVIETLWRDLAAADPAFYVFEREGEPWTWIFRDTIDTELGAPRYLGEDVAFMHRARAAGFRVECLADAWISHAGLVFNLGAQIDAERLREVTV